MLNSLSWSMTVRTVIHSVSLSDPDSQIALRHVSSHVHVQVGLNNFSWHGLWLLEMRHDLHWNLLKVRQLVVARFRDSESFRLNVNAWKSF